MEAKQDIIQATEQDYVKLRAAIDGLDEAQMSEVWLGTWGVREILAHVAGWQVEMLPALERLALGEEPYVKGTYDDFDRWNARFVDARKEQVAWHLSKRALDQRVTQHAIAPELSDERRLQLGSLVRLTLHWVVN